MTDNFDHIRSLLSFENPDALYVINLLQRKKDLPELKKGCRKLTSFYLRSLDDFDKCKEKIVRDCACTGARAYIDVNAKDVKKVALLALKKTSELIYSGDYDAVKNAYSFACGNATCLGQKLWLVDIDTKDAGTVQRVLNRLSELDAEVKAHLPSKSGHHLLTTPFPCNRFDVIENVDVIKHGHTLLYMAGAPDPNPDCHSESPGVSSMDMQKHC